MVNRLPWHEGARVELLGTSVIIVLNRARWYAPIGNLAKPDFKLHNIQMDSPFFFNFLQHIAVGAASVFALLLIIWVSTPRRSFQPATQRTLR
ncbi:MAG TPA: hypothetical protein VLK33_05650 [Terriglobales bacterium]|nr:hypothetical protein [Terriglobales bacterium]